MCVCALYCVSVQKVTAGDQTWSVSCPSCPCSLCSPLVSTSSPPMTTTNMWTYLTRSALPCVVLGVSASMFVVGIVHVCGGQCTCVCLHTCTHVCMYCYCTHTYSINLCHLLHTVLYGCLCVKLPRVVKSHDHHMEQWSHLPPSCGLYSPKLEANVLYMGITEFQMTHQ